MSFSSKQPFFLGLNWKLHPNSFAGLEELLQDYINHHKEIAIDDDGIETVVFPPVVFLSQASKYLGTHPAFHLGSADVFYQNSGAFTGQISPSSLKEFGVKYTLIGHSELRDYKHYTRKDNQLRIQASVKNNLQPVICIGHQSTKSQSSHGSIDVDILLQDALELIESDLSQQRFIIAYEPVWAIGSGKPASSEHIADIFDKIYNQVLTKFDQDVVDRLQLVYGGSVNGDNAKDLLEIPHLEGFLVGGASLKAEEIAKIYKHVSICL